jgi:tetratricopeptide (TPR) repeat protein
VERWCWRRGGFKTATNPNSAAYYLLAVAYYQQDDFARALTPAKKAVELMDKPNESWLSMLSALHLQREEYKEAVPVLQRLIAVVPDKKTYWTQPRPSMGRWKTTECLGHHATGLLRGLVTEDSEVRRLADRRCSTTPYRGAQVLEAAIEKKTVTVTTLYEKLANC